MNQPFIYAGEQDVSYPVKFVTFGGNVPASNSFNFGGKGEIRIGADSIRVSGQRQRFFRSRVPEQHTLPSNTIFNARAIGTILQFDALDADGKTWHKIGCIAADPQSTLSMLSALPARQTDAFAAEHAEHRDFQQRLDTLSPSAPVTTVLVMINVIVFALMVLNGAGFMVANGPVAIQWGSNFGPLTINGQWWRLLSSTFIHFGIIHLAFNMLALYSTGKMVERMYGSLQFSLLYIFSGVAGSLVSLWWHPDINSAGASGAIFGVFGGILAFMLNRNNGVPKTIMNAHSKSTALFIGYNLLFGFSQTGIDNGAHIGGLLGGIIFGALLARPMEFSARAHLLSIRLVLASLASVVVLGGLAYPVFRPDSNARKEAHFNEALIDIQSKETQAVAELNALAKLIQERSIGKDGVADRLDNVITPHWQAMFDGVAEPQLNADSKNFPLQQALSTYLHDRILYCKLFAQGTRTQNSDLIRQAREADADGRRAVELIQKLPVR